MLIVKVVLRKLLSSLLKGATAALLTSLLAASNALPVGGDDKVVVAVVAGFTALLHAAISGLKRLSEFDPNKIVK